MNYKWLIDAGHGGMRNGAYTTGLSKMFVFEDGKTVYEGVNNRAIAKELVRLLEQDSTIDFALVYDELDDTPLGVRVRIANDLSKKFNCIYLSIHSDAVGKENAGKGSGFSIFTSIGQTKSDIIAEVIFKTYEQRFPEFKMRKDTLDTDSDKEENFYVLAKTNCPAVLIENLFFDNRHEADFITSEAGQKRIAEAIYLSIIKIETTKPI